ncbi:hypothetical protein Z043_101384 [Scleropages formosus]|uniref:Uncharacterized protein n=1 Tax=Scleropages formosus TaxID=113540 RepID=A0A0N8K2Y9_SCLFO|nr:hypothetical protein Z043_101384 [Scleropages formosus]
MVVKYLKNLFQVMLDSADSPLHTEGTGLRLSKHAICELSPFFKKGVFDYSSHVDAVAAQLLLPSVAFQPMVSHGVGVWSRCGRRAQQEIHQRGPSHPLQLVQPKGTKVFLSGNINEATDAVETIRRSVAPC